MAGTGELCDLWLSCKESVVTMLFHSVGTPSRRWRRPRTLVVYIKVSPFGFVLLLYNNSRCCYFVLQALVESMQAVAFISPIVCKESGVF